MWKRRYPDGLTPRESEVLGLIRLGLTNEEIAQRLGITVAGAKYHVSQILSKLGVASREEAVVVALKERRWWAAWPLWAKMAGAATVVAAVGGLALLAWGVVRTDRPGDESAPRLDSESDRLIQSAAEAVIQPGVLHVTTSGGGDIWIDSERRLFRQQSGVEGTGDFSVRVGRDWSVTLLLPDGEVSTWDRTPPLVDRLRINHPVILWLEPLRFLASADSASVSHARTDVAPFGFTLVETRSDIEGGEYTGSTLAARIEMRPGTALIAAYETELVPPGGEPTHLGNGTGERVEYWTMEFLETQAFPESFFSPDVVKRAADGDSSAPTP